MNPRENELMTLLVLLHLAFQEIVLMLATNDYIHA